mgnify:CR=1 FL=1
MGRFDIRTRSGQISAIIQGQAATSTDGDAQAFFDRVTAAGGTLTQTEKDAVNTLTVSLKSAGVWTLIKAIYPMVGASAAACAQNLKSSSFTGTFSSGWTFASTGVTPNGTSAFMNTFLPPNGNLAQDDAHASMYCRTNQIGVTSVDLGCGSTGSNQDFYLSVFYGTAGVLANINGSGGTGGATNITSLGFFLAQRVSSSSTFMYQNNTQVHSHTKVSTTPSSVNINLGRNTTSEYSSREMAFISFGSSFDATQRGNLNSAVQTFQTSLNRNV